MSDAIAMDWVATCKGSGSDAVRMQVEELQADDLVKLSTRRRGKLLVLDVGARITSANQKWMEVPGDEDDGMEPVAALVKARADFRRGCLRRMGLPSRAARSARVFTNAATVFACNSRPAIAAYGIKQSERHTSFPNSRSGAGSF